MDYCEAEVKNQLTHFQERSGIMSAATKPTAQHQKALVVLS